MAGSVIIISSTTDVADALRRERERRGMTGEDMDAKVGWADRYTAKVENPEASWGKNIVRVYQHTDYWLQAMGLALVLIDRDEALRRSFEQSQEPVSSRAFPLLTKRRQAVLSY